MRHTLSHTTEWGPGRVPRPLALCFPDTQLKAMAGNYSVSVHSPGPGQELLQASFIGQSRIPGWLSCPHPGSPFALLSVPPLEQALPWGLGSRSYFLSPLGDKYPPPCD